MDPCCLDVQAEDVPSKNSKSLGTRELQWVDACSALSPRGRTSIRNGIQYGPLSGAEHPIASGRTIMTKIIDKIRAASIAVLAKVVLRMCECMESM